ncbi:PfkB family carbohydrate kinase, partial [Campylobacterota bacterium]
FSDDEIINILSHAEVGDVLLLQNEINSLEKILQLSKTRGVRVIFNPAPMNEKVKSYPLEYIDIFIINALEGEMLTGEKDPQKIMSRMQELYPHSSTVLTLGKEGLIYIDKDTHIKMDALKVETIDTTGAGDTFIGYFVAGLAQKESIEKCLQMGVKASALCVGRQGAGDSIPTRDEVDNFNAAVRHTPYRGQTLEE